MKFTPVPTLQSDLQQLREVPPLRLRLFGRSFGPSLQPSELRLRASEDGRLRAQVRFGFFWLKMPESLLEPILARHFALDTKRALLASVQNPHVAVPQRPALQRANAMRRVPSPAAAQAEAPLPPLRDVAAKRDVQIVTAPPAQLVRHGSFSAAIFHADDDGASSAGDPSETSRSASSQRSTPPSSYAVSPALEGRPGVDLDAYCDLMAQNVGPGRPYATFGTQIEARALADVTGRPVYVLSQVGAGDAVSYGKHQIYFPSEGLDVSARPIALLLRGGGTGAATHGNHYEPLTGGALAGLWTPELLVAAYSANGQADAVLDNFWTPGRVASLRGEALADGNCLFDAVGQQLAAVQGTPAAPRAGRPRAEIPEAHALADGLRQQTAAFLRAHAKDTVMSVHTMERLSDGLEPLMESLRA